VAGNEAACALLPPPEPPNDRKADDRRGNVTGREGTVREIVDKVGVVCAAEASRDLARVADILKQDLDARGGIQATGSDDAPWEIALSLDAALAEEAFRISDRPGGVEIAGGSQRGVLYGAGKFLHSSRYTADGLTPSSWRGESAPRCPWRAIYFATHFNNFYETASTDEVVTYIEELGLWGYNTVLICYAPWEFSGLDDPRLSSWLARFRTILGRARECGVQVGLLMNPNEGFTPAPPELARTKVPGKCRGNFGQGLCPSKPEARRLLLDSARRAFDEFAEVGLDYLVLWPYDEGGCGCPDCWPWGAKGYVSISKDVVAELRKRFPACKVVLSTWCFEAEDDSNPDGEWVGLAAELAKDKSWVDYIMADGHLNYFPGYIIEKGVPGDLPLVNFPEISMFSGGPWGGYGANPAPQHFQSLWNRIKGMAAGGAPYSEGIYEDFNKVLISGFYWDPDRPAEARVREYLEAITFGDDVEELMETMRILESNHYHKMDWIDAIHDVQPGVKRKTDGPIRLLSKVNADAVRCFQIVDEANRRLPQAARRAWRWRILYLRALIDKELYERDGILAGPVLQEAFAELTRIYHAEHVHSKPVKPPRVYSL